jgi:phospholipase D1/2
LEALDPNICIFRHPDHLPDKDTVAESLVDKFKEVTLSIADASKLTAAEKQSIYGLSNDVVLYWAHHEKLCLIDGETAFMGGLDLCFGRWDTNAHPIADAHPGDLDQIVFPGQDYNNARIMDFKNVQDWESNKLDRRKNSRMGWSDLSVSLTGPVVETLNWHFADRWNFIYNEKYTDQPRYKSIAVPQLEEISDPKSHVQNLENKVKSEVARTPDAGSSSKPAKESLLKRLKHKISDRKRSTSPSKTSSTAFRSSKDPAARSAPLNTGVGCQIVRSATKWSAGVITEHSIYNAYVQLIQNAEHFIYIENQFFITATGDRQHPVENQMGKAIADRIIRAGKEGANFKVIVLIPGIPGFAGDLRADGSLGTRAIMEYQYNSINRGGNSIMQKVKDAGFNPLDYIRFFNLRNYDRINVSLAMKEIEDQCGVDYESARKEHDDKVGAGYGGSGEGTTHRDKYDKYQAAAKTFGSLDGLGDGTWDTVSGCYMEGGKSLNDTPWQGGNVTELDAFVTEELYIHTKVGLLLGVIEPIG